MTAYAVTTKIIIGEPSTLADSVTGSFAKAISDYIETIDDSKTIRSTSMARISNALMAFTIVHDA